MQSKYGFDLMTLNEFEKWINKLKVRRTVIYIQQHHTWNPNYSSFKGNNHFDIQRAMKNHHVGNNGWMDIGQHFSTFPDGTIITGRSLEHNPACIYGNNSHSICIEHVGNFDKNRDKISKEHSDTAVAMTAILCERFSIPVNTDRIVYHHWFNLSSGVRNNGSGGNKSCPGTGFFGGNKVADCEANFIPLVKAKINNEDGLGKIQEGMKHYVYVTATKLNVRKGPGSGFDRVQDRGAALFGAVLRVFKEKNGWLKISESKEHWVSGRYTDEVQRATVTANTLNVRSGAGTNYPKTGAVKKGQEMFIELQDGNWAKLLLEDRWVSNKYLSYQD